MGLPLHTHRNRLTSGINSSVILNNGLIPLDNNLAENAIRVVSQVNI